MKNTEHVTRKSNEQTVHTPGPWDVSAYSECKVVARAHGGAMIADTANVIFSNQAETRANAQLIAAAPNLLYALRRLIQELPCKRDWLDPDLECFAKAAISKAQPVSSIGSSQGNSVSSKTTNQLGN